MNGIPKKCKCMSLNLHNRMCVPFHGTLDIAGEYLDGPLLCGRIVGYKFHIRSRTKIPFRHSEQFEPFAAFRWIWAGWVHTSRRNALDSSFKSIERVSPVLASKIQLESELQWQESSDQCSRQRNYVWSMRWNELLIEFIAWARRKNRPNNCVCLNWIWLRSKFLVNCRVLFVAI